MKQKFELELDTDTTVGLSAQQIFEALKPFGSPHVKELQLDQKIIIKRAVVTSVGKPKHDEAKHNDYSWVKISASPKEQQILFKLYKGQPLWEKLHNGNLVSAEFRYLSRDKTISFAPAPDRLEVIGEEYIQLTHEFKLPTITFHDSFVTLDEWFGSKQPVILDSGFKCDGWRGNLLDITTLAKTLGARRIYCNIDSATWSSFQPDFDLSATHNKIKDKLPMNVQLDSFVKVSGFFGVNYNIDETITLFPKEDLTIILANIMSLKKAVEDSAIAYKWKQIRERLREILSTKHVLSLDEARNIFDAYGWVGNNVEATLKNFVWAKDYNEEYFNFVKLLAGSNPVYFSEKGYFFPCHWKGLDYTIWEVPDVDTATYIFTGKPEDVVTRLGDLNRSEIRQSKSVGEPGWDFVRGWVNHLVGYESGWEDRIKEILDGKRVSE